MIIFVRMLAFHAPDHVRMVKIPNSHDIDTILNLAYEYGQNENCTDRRITNTTRSVSVGDVVELPEGNFMVMPFGFRRLTDAEYDRYKSIPDNRERVIHAYTGNL